MGKNKQTPKVDHQAQKQETATQRKAEKQEIKRFTKKEESESDEGEEDEETILWRLVLAKILPYITLLIKAAVVFGLVGSLGYVEFHRGNPNSQSFH